MASSDKIPTRSLAPAERAMIASALELQAKSHDRAAKVAPSPSIEGEFTRLAAQCRNLAAHVTNGSLEV